MNERINELVKEAGLTLVPNSKPIIYQGPMSELEKFAELIVEECFKAAMIESKGHMNPIDLIKRMKEQVGVEE